MHLNYFLCVFACDYNTINYYSQVILNSLYKKFAYVGNFHVVINPAGLFDLGLVQPYFDRPFWA